MADGHQAPESEGPRPPADSAGSHDPIESTIEERLEELRTDSPAERKLLARAIGGWRGIIDSGLPSAVFVVVYSFNGHALAPAVWSAVAVGAIIAVLRLIRREDLTQIAGGFAGILVSAFVASRTGAAEDFFLPGLLVNLAYGSAALLSVLVGWPLLGFLLTQYTITGFDASAHLSEETKSAANGAAKGIWRSIFYSAVGGWILLLSFLFAVQDVDEAAGRLVKVLREFRPHVVTTYDENGGYPHPDHIMTHTVSMSAFAAAGDPAAYPHAGQPWQPLKLYYNQTFSRTRILAFHEALLAEGLESPYGEWMTRWPDRPERTVTTQVECADYFPARDAALRAHATQIDADSTFFAVPHELQRRIWPHEDYELALAYVPVELPESELFAGLGSVAAADAAATRGAWQAEYDGRTMMEGAR